MLAGSGIRIQHPNNVLLFPKKPRDFESRGPLQRRRTRVVGRERGS